MDYRHFSINQLGEGVYGAIHREGGAANSNAAIIDLGEETLVFDTFDTVLAARELRAACEDLTGRLPVWVVNSHRHGDHWGGNQVFRDTAVVVATHGTREAMLAESKEVERMRKNPGEVKARILALELELASAVEDTQKKIIEKKLIRNRFFLEDLPNFVFFAPTHTFDGQLTWYGSKREAKLIRCGPAHTRDECYLVVGDGKIVITGDLAFFESPPFIAPGCSMAGWQEMLDNFIHGPGEVFLPGHGRIGGKKDLERVSEYLSRMVILVSGAVEGSVSLEECLKLPLPEGFADWAVFGARHENNLKTLYQQVTGK